MMLHERLEISLRECREAHAEKTSFFQGYERALQVCISELKAHEQSPQPPVKVKMRVLEHDSDEHCAWQFKLGPAWVGQSTPPFRPKDVAKRNGTTWLATLSVQLNVPLKAEWVDEQEKT